MKLRVQSRGLSQITQILGQIEHGDPSAGRQTAAAGLPRAAPVGGRAGRAGAGGRSTTPRRWCTRRTCGWSARRSSRSGTAAGISLPPPPKPCGASSWTTPAAAPPQARRRPSARRSRRTSSTADAQRGLLALDEALTRLSSEDAAKAQVVKLRYFAGLSHRRDGRRVGDFASAPPSAAGPMPAPGSVRARTIRRRSDPPASGNSHCSCGGSSRTIMSGHSASTSTRSSSAIEIDVPSSAEASPGVRRRRAAAGAAWRNFWRRTCARGSFSIPPPGCRPNRRKASNRHDLGPYKLLEQIGEGGFGTVYMAEQTQPVQRARGAEGHQAGHGHAAGDRPLRGRAAGAGDDGPPQHRQSVRRRRHRRPAGRTS